MVFAMGLRPPQCNAAGLSRGFVTLGQDVCDLLAATRRDLTRALQLRQTVHGGADHVVRVLRPGRFCHDVLDAQHLENGAHRTTRDDPGAFRGGAHDDLARTVTPFDIVVKRAAFLQRHAKQAALGLLGRLADAFGHFLGLAFAETNAAALIADHHESREAETLTTLHGLGNPVDRDQAVGEFRGFLAIVAAAPPASVFTFCHVAIPLDLVTPRSVGCFDRGGHHDPRIIEGAHNEAPFGFFAAAQLDPKTGAQFSGCARH
jgi:hypothetical protein